ncbi:bifunctional glutamate N-acetyltransferase/amino-acid acetyltransferase ArgJ [Candidatus Latescibacterota bacterium]
MIDISGGITAPRGFRAGATDCGIKDNDKLDLTILMSDSPATCAGMFTTNRVKGAPVLVSRENVKNGSAQAIIANSGNANVCNGEHGFTSAFSMIEETAGVLKIDSSDVLVASTGVIGRRFPIEKVLKGIPLAASDLSTDGGERAARAIMTTDTVHKQTSIEVGIGGEIVRIGAIAKGAGMICPTLATMFCFVTTDAAIETAALRKALKSAVSASFNCITVDGDMSTSDTVLILANGEAGNVPLKSRSRAFDIFTEALTEVCLRMAKALVQDAEGATRLITIRVTGASGREDAHRVGMSVANSPLVKTASFGSDPNWGRIICAIGYSGVPVDEHLVTIAINGVTLYETGKVLPMDEPAMRKNMSNQEINIDIDLGMGQAESVVYTSDLSYEYVKINAEYTT